MSGVVRGAEGRRGIEVGRHENQFRRRAGQFRFDVVQLPAGVRELVQPDNQFSLADRLKLLGDELRRGLVSGMENMPAGDHVRGCLRHRTPAAIAFGPVLQDGAGHSRELLGFLGSEVR